MRKLRDVAATGSQLMVIPKATHEALPYYFENLVPPVLEWLAGDTVRPGAVIQETTIPPP
jgi:hypothetical protein